LFPGKDAPLPEALFGLRSNAGDVDKGVFKQVATSVSAADPESRILQTLEHVECLLWGDPIMDNSV
jgi:hypothetical protein